MEKAKKDPLTEDTIIGLRKISAAEFRKFFKKTLGDDYENNPVARSFIKLPLNHKGKTLKQVIEECNNPVLNKSLAEILDEDRFKIISTSDKSFIVTLDRAMNEVGYDFGGAIIGNKDLMAIIYGKTGTKTRTRPACFHIYDDGKIVLKLYLNKVDAHRQYIENAVSHIKEIFTNIIGNCNACNFRDGKCKYKCTKTYTIDGRLFHKCCFELTDLVVENIPDYIDLLSRFHPKIKRACARVSCQTNFLGDEKILMR